MAAAMTAGGDVGLACLYAPVYRRAGRGGRHRLLWWGGRGHHQPAYRAAGRPRPGRPISTISAAPISSPATAAA